MFFVSTYIADLEVFPNAGASVSTSALQGGSFTYDYPVVKSFPKPQITWTKSGSTLNENERVSFSNTGNLYIGNVDVNDAGNYKSKVENTVTSQSYDRGTISLGVTGKSSVSFNKLLLLINNWSRECVKANETFFYLYNCNYITLSSNNVLHSIFNFHSVLVH